MNSSGDLTLATSLAATLVGTGVAVAMWRRQIRLARASRRSHPSMQPPLSIAAVGVAGSTTRRWQVTVRPDVPPVSVDIVTFRGTASRQPWTSEPIVEPIRIDPGETTLLPSAFGPAPAYDAVIAWTVHQPTGDVQGSRTFHVLDVEAGTAAGSTARPGRGRPHADLVVIGLLVAAVCLVVWGLLAHDDNDQISGAAAPTRLEADGPTTTTTTLTTTVTTDPPTTISTAATAPATAIVPPPPTTTNPAIATEPPATTNPTITTGPPTTQPPSTSGAAGPRVVVTSSVGECQFGANCLIAGFTITGFDSSPNQYVCEFADGTRVSFGFGGVGVAAACATGSADAAITIEVGGIRSETVTRSAAGNT